MDPRDDTAFRSKIFIRPGGVIGRPLSSASPCVEDGLQRVRSAGMLSLPGGRKTRALSGV